MRVIQYPDDLDSKFKFITVAALRCRQLQKGAKPRVSSPSKKFTTIAQEEVLADQVPFSEGPSPDGEEDEAVAAGSEEIGTAG